MLYLILGLIGLVLFVAHKVSRLAARIDDLEDEMHQNFIRQSFYARNPADDEDDR